jgi:hypothetical protein
MGITVITEIMATITYIQVVVQVLLLIFLTRVLPMGVLPMGVLPMGVLPMGVLPMGVLPMGVPIELLPHALIAYHRYIYSWVFYLLYY